MKNKQLFFQIERCTGCQLCVMACSLVNKGSCGKSDSLINILTHPEFGTSIPILDSVCLNTECHGECVEVCTPACLKLADGNLIHRLLIRSNWQPVAIKEKGRK
jgi:Fe-S-cluster-containing dehydrogenase component